MCPEDALGGGVQSASILWERVESLFQGIRDVMQKNGNSRSGSFSMPWTAACMTFIEVRSPLTLNCMGIDRPKYNDEFFVYLIFSCADSNES